MGQGSPPAVYMHAARVLVKSLHGSVKAMCRGQGSLDDAADLPPPSSANHLHTVKKHSRDSTAQVIRLNNSANYEGDVHVILSKFRVQIITWDPATRRAPRLKWMFTEPLITTAAER